MFGLDSLIENTVGKIVDKGLKFIPDPQQQTAFIKEMRDMDLTELKQQIDIDLEEAKSEKWWKAGWRPFVGWVCGAAFAYSYIIQPFLDFIVRIWVPDFKSPQLDMAELAALLFGMLGLSHHRSKEKQQIVGAKTDVGG